MATLCSVCVGLVADPQIVESPGLSYDERGGVIRYWSYTVIDYFVSDVDELFEPGEALFDASL